MFGWVELPLLSQPLNCYKVKSKEDWGDQTASQAPCCQYQLNICVSRDCESCAQRLCARTQPNDFMISFQTLFSSPACLFKRADFWRVSHPACYLYLVLPWDPQMTFCWLKIHTTVTSGYWHHCLWQFSPEVLPPHQKVARDIVEWGGRYHSCMSWGSGFLLFLPLGWWGLWMCP